MKKQKESVNRDDLVRNLATDDLLKARDLPLDP